jgi:DNA-directed RNA polymerase specialized sigma24 family protein
MNRSIRAFQQVERMHNELGRFQNPLEVLAYLRGLDGDLDCKDRIYAALIGMVQRDEERELAFALLFLGLWPGLDGAFRRRVGRERVDPGEIVSAIYEHFAVQIERFDAARVRRVAASLVRSTEREVGSDLRKQRPEAGDSWEEDTVDDVFASPISELGIPPCFDTETNLELLRDRLFPVIEDEHELVLAIAVEGQSQLEAAESFGLSYEAARKRYQRARLRLLAWMQEDCDDAGPTTNFKKSTRRSPSPRRDSACSLMLGRKPNQGDGAFVKSEPRRETMAQDFWKQTEEMAKQHEQSGGDWLKLQNDGDKAVVVFLGQPYPREVCFVDGKFIPMTDALKGQGCKASLRVALNVAVFGSKEVKVLEQGVRFFKDLVRVRDKYTLEKWAFEVTRHGAAKDTNTTYSILPDQQLTAEQIREYQSLKLLDLVKLYDSVAAEGASAPDAMIDPQTALAIATTLKTLPREAVEQFCTALGVQRIKDLRAAQIAKAKVFVEALVNEFSPDSQVDPFA